jgi:AraC-like DNA-binding protein
MPRSCICDSTGQEAAPLVPGSKRHDLPAAAASTRLRLNGSAIGVQPEGPNLGKPGPRTRWMTSQPEAARRIEVSLAHMRQHLNEPLRVSQLSALAGVSVSHFFALFRCATGRAPNDFLIRLRITRACELLQFRNLSIKQVADFLGYDDQFYFSRLFKSVTGMAPRQYRSIMAELKYTKPLEDLKAALPTSGARNSSFMKQENQPVHQQLNQHPI